MRSLLLVASLLGPAPTDEGVVYDGEPAPTEPAEPIEPVIVPAPVIVSTPELTPTPAPTPEPPPLVAPPLALPPPPPPPTGSGRLVGGSFALALGVGAASAVIVESTRENGNPRFVAVTFVQLGLASIGVGTYLLVRGAKARSNYNDWRAFTNSDALPTGDGLIVGGTMSTLVGGVTLVAAAVQARDPDAMTQPLTPTLFAIGATGVAVGVGALTWGLLRRGKYRSWRQSTFLHAAELDSDRARLRLRAFRHPSLRYGPKVQRVSWGLHALTPTITPTPDLRGASFGVAARL